MPAQWAGRIAGQSSPFIGTSTFGVQQGFGKPFGNRAVASAVYVATVTGGISGTFGVNVIGVIGMKGSATLPNATVTGCTMPLAGITGIAAAGTFVLFPYAYGPNGVAVLGFTPADIVNRLDQTVPPFQVQFQSNSASGVSAHIVVNALLYTN